MGLFFYTAAFSGYDAYQLMMWILCGAIIMLSLAVKLQSHTCIKPLTENFKINLAESHVRGHSTAEGIYIPGAWKNICTPESSHRRNYCK